MPAAHPAPSYDLDADLTSRKSDARELFGERAQIAVVHDVFVFAGPGGGQSGASFRSALSVAEQALDAYFNGRFSKVPVRAISVNLFPTEVPYQGYCRARWQEECISIYGFYLRSDRTIVMNVGPGIGTLTHELVHPLVEADFPDAPEWLNEGIASLFEQFYFPRAGQIAGGKNWRHPRLIQALSSKHERDKVTLPALVRLSDAAFRGDKEDLNYAMARYLCQWLDQQGKLWPFYHRLRDADATGERAKTAERAFAESVGMTLDEATPQWIRWVRAL